MKIKRAVKTALAVVLSVTIALGLMGGVAPVKSFAVDSVNISLSIGQTYSFWVNGHVNRVGLALASGLGHAPDTTVSFSDYDGTKTKITITVGHETPGEIIDITLGELAGPDLYYYHVTVLGATSNPDSNPGDKPSNNGEDPALRTLPPTGPDGHQHDWHWEYGSTYHCSICNTFYTVYPAHDHQYEWYVTKPATETDDGEAHHMCKICGSVDLIEPVGAYYLFSQNAENKINKAPIGGTVNVETTRWLSFQGYVLDALAKRPDVTLNVTFRENGYKGGEVKTVTIPAGYDAASLKDANGYCGFKYLAGVFGAN